MSIEVTARHMSASGEIQDYARAKAEELLGEFPTIEHIHVILNVERHLNIAEAIVQARNHARIEGKASSENMRASIDMAVDKAEKQLRKNRKKTVDHKVVMKREEATHLRGDAEK